MSESEWRQNLGRNPSYNRWVAVFIMIVIGTGALFYYASQKVSYVWRWNRVPKYFAYLDNVEIIAEINGEIQRITSGDKLATILVMGDDEQELLEVPKDAVIVEEGYLISPGDVLATYQKWKVGILILGLWMTLKVSIVATLAGIFIGIIGGIARLSDNPALKWTTIAYVELIRGSPLMVQILIWYFVLGTLINDLIAVYGFGRIDAFWYAAASLACFAGAYVTEIVRSGIQSIHRGQTEAARSLGMTYAECMIHIILPQALRRILPPLAGQFISLIKDSSLLGMIAIRELTKATREVVSSSLQPFELYILCGLLYLVLTIALSLFVQHLERRTQPT
jgi:polar amino acid transport system permease protein